MTEHDQTTHALVCVECAAEAPPGGVGWRAMLTVGDEDAEDAEDVAVYCPACARGSSTRPHPDQAPGLSSVPSLERGMARSQSPTLNEMEPLVYVPASRKRSGGRRHWEPPATRLPTSCAAITRTAKPAPGGLTRRAASSTSHSGEA
jgi:hypothetical protein